MRTRKYPSEQKTTTLEGKREYSKLQIRASRECQKAEQKAVLEQVRAFPEFQQLPKAEQVALERVVIHILADFDVQLEQKEEETKQLIKLKVDALYASASDTIKRLKALKEQLKV